MTSMPPATGGHLRDGRRSALPAASRWSVVVPAQVAAGVALAVLGLTVAVAWLTRNEGLMRVHPLFPPMPYTAALGFLVCGVALLANAGARQRLAGGSALAVLLLGALTLAVHGLHGEWHLARTLLPGPTPNDMTPDSALSFVLIGVGLLAVALHHQRGSLVGALCGTTVAAQNSVAFLGYSFGVASPYIASGNAPHVAVGLALAGAGTIAAASIRSPGAPRGAPRWLPLPVALAIVLFSVSLWYQADAVHQATLEEATRAKAERLAPEVNRRARPTTAALERIAAAEGARLEHRTGVAPSVLAELELERDPILQGVAALDGALESRWLETRPPGAMRDLPQATIERLRGRLPHAASAPRRVVIEPATLDAGRPGFVVAVPIVARDRLEGYVLGLFTYEDFFRATLSESLGTDYQVRVLAGSRVVYGLGEPPDDDTHIAGVGVIPFLDSTWHAQIWPSATGGPQAPVTDRTLLLGLAFAGLIGCTVHLGQRSARRREQLADVLAAQAESETRYRQIIDDAADIICRTDRNGRLTFVNPATLRVTKLSQEDLIGRSCLSLIRPDYRSAARRLYARQAADRTPTTYFDYPAVVGDGRTVWIGQHVRLLTEGGRVVGFQAVARDISERMRTQQDLQRMRDTALETARLKSEFVATTSHEIRTPLNGILGFSDLLADTALTPEQRHYAEGLRTSADALLSIVNDILDFSKIEAGMLRLDVVPFELRATIDSVIVMLSESARRKQIGLQVEIQEGLPARVQGDPGRLRQVLTNLIANAIRFTDRGLVTLGVTCESETDTHALVRFSVTDTGIGIDDDTRERLFRPFVQGDGSAGRRWGGTGLGLTISRQLVDLMGGAIDVKSAPGHGSTFSFVARLQRDADVPVGEPDRAVDLAGVRLLIAADASSFRDELVGYAGTWGMEVATARVGLDALGMLREAAVAGAPYDVAVLSLAHPGENAMELARDIKAEPAIAAVRVVITPLKGMRGEATEALRTGVAAYLPRPIQQDELRRCLVSVMAAPGAGRAPGGGPAKLVTRHTLVERHGALRGRILVADDHPVSRDVTRLALEKLGHVVDVVSDGAAAVQALADTGYALVLMDCQMPRMDGYEATAEIRRTEAPGRRTPIVAFTANTSPSQRERCVRAGMDDVVEKPVRRDELMDLLARWIPAGPTAPGTDVARIPSAGLDVMVDVDIHRALQDELGRDVLGQMEETHLQLVGEAIGRMEGMLAAAEDAALRQEAHRLRGGSMTLGFTRMGRICAQLEDWQEGGQGLGRRELVEHLKQALAELQAERRPGLRRASVA